MPVGSSPQRWKGSGHTSWGQHSLQEAPGLVSPPDCEIRASRTVPPPTRVYSDNVAARGTQHRKCLPHMPNTLPMLAQETRSRDKKLHKSCLHCEAVFIYWSGPWRPGRSCAAQLKLGIPQIPTQPGCGRHQIYPGYLGDNHKNVATVPFMPICQRSTG